MILLGNMSVEFKHTKSAKKNGIIPFNTLSKGTPEIPDITNTFIPTGGVMASISGLHNSTYAKPDGIKSINFDNRNQNIY